MRCVYRATHHDHWRHHWVGHQLPQESTFTQFLSKKLKMRTNEDVYCHGQAAFGQFGRTVQQAALTSLQIQGKARPGVLCSRGVAPELHSHFCCSGAGTDLDAYVMHVTSSEPFHLFEALQPYTCSGKFASDLHDPLRIPLTYMTPCRYLWGLCEHINMHLTLQIVCLGT
jgi:hypothetical protein